MVDRRTAILLLGVLTLVGCGTTNWTDTKRTATEQLLLSTALDDAVEGIDFGVLSGETAYLDTSYLEDTVDHEYLVGCLTERLRSQGCVLKDKPSDATFIVEARAGAVGTNRHKSIIGIPASHVTMPVGSKKGESVNVPDLVLAGREKQSGVARIACFAYRRETGQAFWQSGTVPVSVSTNETIVAGINWSGRGRVFQRLRAASARRNRERQVVAAEAPSATF